MLPQVAPGDHAGEDVQPPEPHELLLRGEPGLVRVDGWRTRGTQAPGASGFGAGAACLLCPFGELDTVVSTSGTSLSSPRPWPRPSPTFRCPCREGPWVGLSQAPFVMRRLARQSKRRALQGSRVMPAIARYPRVRRRTCFGEVGRRRRPMNTKVVLHSIGPGNNYLINGEARRS